MKLDLERLAELDPTRVPLPVGTEVETRVVGFAGERRVPHGAVGRVRSTEGERVVVAVVGVGDVEYLRTDIAPRKAGQLRFALRRQNAWSQLRHNAIAVSTVGSRAWGLAGPDSDLDQRGVFALPLSWTLGLGDPPTELVSLDGSQTFWELGKTVAQGLRADPNTLEMLHVESAHAIDEVGQWLLDAKDAFVSSAIYGSFGRYALGQFARLRQSLRLAEHRELLFEWLKVEPSLDLDRAAERLAAAARVEAPTPEGAFLRAKEYIKQLYSSLFDRGLLAERDYASLTALAASADRAALTVETPRELRPKNAYNLLRLIESATVWLTTGAPRFAVAEPLRSELLAIKRGEVELAAVIERADELAAGLEEARRNTVLPAKPDLAVIDAVLARIRGEVSRRFVDNQPGPFGADAEPRPPLSLE